MTALRSRDHGCGNATISPRGSAPYEVAIENQAGRVISLGRAADPGHESGSDGRGMIVPDPAAGAEAA